MGTSVLSQITAIDHAVPQRGVTELRARILAAESTRDSRTNWCALAAAPRHVFEQVIQHLRHHVPGADSFVGAEWWVRATPTDTDFPFHFDRDEGIRDRIVSPGVASILYLSNTGGPTLVLDATPSRASAPTTGIAMHPRAGRFGMFPGALLHGVVPSAASRWPRITMLINWWNTVPRMERATPLRATRCTRWPVGPRPRPVALEAFDPSRLLSKAAWRDVITGQTTYR